MQREVGNNMRMTVTEVEDERLFHHSRCGGSIIPMRSEAELFEQPTIQYRGTGEKGKGLWQIFGMCSSCGKEGWFQNYPVDEPSGYVDMKRPMYGKPRPKKGR